MNKEEIEKAKEKLNKYVDKVNRNKRILEGSEIQTSEAIETFLQYTDQLEQENNKQNKIIDEMADKIYKEGIIWENKEEVKQYFEKKVDKDEGKKKSNENK